MATNVFAAGAYAAVQNLTGPIAKKAVPVSGPDFGALLNAKIADVAEAGRKGEAQALAVANGKADIVDVVTAVAESEAALETLVAVRDRVIAAYEDIMRMPV